jgi:hypothetical protein
MESWCFNTIETGKKCKYCSDFESITMSNTHLIDYLNQDRKYVIYENLDIQETFMDYIVGYKHDPAISSLYNNVKNKNYVVNNNDMNINTAYFESREIDPSSKKEVRNKLMPIRLKWTTLKLNINVSEHVLLPGLMMSFLPSEYTMFKSKLSNLKFIIPDNISIRFRDTLADQNSHDGEDVEYTLPNLSSEFDTEYTVGKVVSYTGANVFLKMKESMKGRIFDKYKLACRNCQKQYGAMNEDMHEYICLHNEGNIDGKNFTCYLYKLRNNALFEDTDNDMIHIFMYFGIWAKKEIRNKPILQKTVKEEIFGAITKKVLNSIRNETGIDTNKKEIIDSIKNYSDLAKFIIGSKKPSLYRTFHEAFKMIVVKEYPKFVKDGKFRRLIILGGYINLWFIDNQQNFEDVANAVKSNIFSQRVLQIDKIYTVDDFIKLSREEQIVFFSFFFHEASEMLILSIVSSKFIEFLDVYRSVSSIIGLDMLTSLFGQSVDLVEMGIETSQFLLKMSILFGIKEFILTKYLTPRGYNRISNNIMLSIFNSKRDIPELEMAYNLSSKGVSDIKFYYLLDAMSRDEKLTDKFGIDANLVHDLNLQTTRELYTRAQL